MTCAGPCVGPFPPASPGGRAPSVSWRRWYENFRPSALLSSNVTRRVLAPPDSIVLYARYLMCLGWHGKLFSESPGVPLRFLKWAEGRYYGGIDVLLRGCARLRIAVYSATVGNELLRGDQLERLVDGFRRLSRIQVETARRDRGDPAQ